MSTETTEGLRFAIAARGTTTHLLPQGTATALCGYTPKPRGMAPIRWYAVDTAKPGHIHWCEKCQQARPVREEAA